MGAPARARARRARAGFAFGPHVPRAQEEVAAAAAAWSQVTSLADATVDEVTSLASEVDVLHIAAHGRHSSDNAMFSGLELADGLLTPPHRRASSLAG